MQFQPPLMQPQHQSMKNLALWMFITSWVCAILSVLFSVSIVFFCVAVPLIGVAFVTHILGFVFLAQIKEASW